jgi:hypothetical protein
VGAYDGSIALAQRLIAARGQPTILRRHLSAAPADPSRPWDVAPPTTQDIELRAVWLPVSLGGRGEGRYGGLEVALTDSEVLIAGGIAHAPTITDRLHKEAGDDGWAIIGVKTLSPGGDDVLYTLIARA